MNRGGKLVILAIVVASILQIGQTTVENHVWNRIRRLERREVGARVEGSGEVGASGDAGVTIHVGGPGGTLGGDSKGGLLGGSSGSGGGHGGGSGGGHGGGGVNSLGGLFDVIGSGGGGGGVDSLGGLFDDIDSEGGLLFGGGGGGEIGHGVTDHTNSLSELLSVPLEVINSLSGVGSDLTTGLLSIIVSPLTVSGQVFDSIHLDASPIIGPLSGTVFDSVEAFVDSPKTIQESLSGGLQQVIDGTTGVVTSPFDIFSEALKEGITGILSSSLEVVPALSGNLGETLSGVLEALASPLTVSAEILDGGVESTLKSFGQLLPPSLQLGLPDSFSRGIKAFVESPYSISEAFEIAFDITLDGITGTVSSPLKLFEAIQNGELTLHQISPLIFNEELDNDLLKMISGYLASPLYAVHALSAQLGVTGTGILYALISPLTVSGEILDYTLNVDESNYHLIPEQSDIGLPASFSQGVAAIIKLPSALCSTISDSSHLAFDGLVGLLTSSLTVLSGFSPIPLPGSANNGPQGLIDSPMDLADLASDNFGYTLAGFSGLFASPITLSADLLRWSVNFNVDSLNVLPQQLVTWGVPESIGTPIASFLQVPFDGLLNIIGFLESPEEILDNIGIANVPGSPNAPPIFPLDFPDKLPDVNPPPYNENPPCVPSLSGSVPDNGNGQWD